MGTIILAVMAIFMAGIALRTRSRFGAAAAGLFGVLAPVAAFAQDSITPTITATISSVEDIAKAISSGNGLLAAGLIVMTLVGIAGKMKLLDSVPPEGKKFVAAGLAGLAAAAAGMIAGAGWLTIVQTAVMVALVAVGGWEYLGKFISWLISKITNKPAA